MLGIYMQGCVIGYVVRVRGGDLLSMSASKQPLRKKERVKGMMNMTSVIHCKAR